MLFLEHRSIFKFKVAKVEYEADVVWLQVMKAKIGIDVPKDVHW